MLPIADRHLDYAASVESALAAAGLRVELDQRQEKIGYKIREAQLQKVPYMLVIGDREAADGHRRGAEPGRRGSGRRDTRCLRGRGAGRGPPEASAVGLQVPGCRFRTVPITRDQIADCKVSDSKRG